jgi:hypothetical protein
MCFRFSVYPSTRQRVFQFGALLYAAILATGCAQLDMLSARATGFNVDVADAQNRTMLLNVLRAAHRYPMHFTELSTLSGTESFQTTGSFAFPFSAYRTTGGAASGVRSFTPGATVTQSPTFNVAVLETQEFYQGMLRPLSFEQMLTYVNQGVSSEMVFTLMLGSIIYRPSAAEDPIVIENNFHRLKKTPNKPDPCPGAGSEYECFQLVLRALIARSLSIESASSATNVGPMLEETALKDPKTLKEIQLSGLELAEIKLKDCESATKTDLCPEGIDNLSAENQRLLKAGGTAFRLRSTKSSFRFCFNEAPDAETPAPGGTTGLALSIRTTKINNTAICRTRITKQQDQAAQKTRAQEQESNPVQQPEGAISLGGVSLQVQPRSTEGLIYYLGEIARCDLGLDSESACGTKPSIHTTYRGDDDEDKLFEMHVSGKELVEAPVTEIEVDWDEYTYALSVDPSAHDRSGQVLRILTQLLALNRSAKDFPAPAIVPLLTQ